MRPFASSISRVYLHPLPNLCNKGLFVAMVIAGLALNCSKAWAVQYLAQFQSMNTGKASWTPGETRTVSVTVKNAGTATWTDSGPDINIGIRWNDGGYEVPWRVNAGGLAPGATGTYNLTVTAPNSPNTTKQLVFDVVNESICWFSWNSGQCGPGNSEYFSSNIVITNYEFGDNVWNVYGFSGGTIDLTGTYCGYYTEPLLSYNTTNRWSSGGSPSSASGWQGSAVPVDNHIVVSKRTNFPCGYYQIDIPGHDDDIRVYIDGVQVFEHVGCCDAHTNIWTGCLGSASVIEVRHREYGGGSYQALTFTVFSPVSNGHLFLNGYEGSITTCPGNPVTISQTGGSYSGGHFYYWIGTDAGGGWPNSWDIWNQAHMDEYNPGSVTFNTPGKYVVHTNGHNWCCWGPGVTYYVTVDGTTATAPTNISGTTAICAGGSTTLTASGGTGGESSNLNWFSGACGSIFTQEWFTQPYTTVNTTVNSYNGNLKVTSTSIDPMIVMYPIGSFNPNIYRYIQIRYRVVSGTAGYTEIFYTNARSAGATGDQMVNGALISDGAWHILNIDMWAGTYWKNSNVTGWRFDYCTASGVTMEVDYISLGAGLAVGQGSSITVSPTAATTYYVLRSGCNITGCANTTVTVAADPSAPSATKSPNTASACAGTSLTLINPAFGTGGAGTCNIEYATSTDGGASYSAFSATVPTITATGTDNRIKIRTNCNGPGCDISPQVVYTWTVNALPAFSITPHHVSCYGGNDGTITITASGGTPPYSYRYKKAGDGWIDNWAVFTDNDPPYYIQEIGSLGHGEYNIQLRDSKVCVQTECTITP